MTMQLQHAQAEDAEELSELDLLLFGEDCLGPSTYRQEIKTGACLILRDSGKIVGYALIRPGAMHDLLRLGIHPNHQDKHLGKELLAEARRQFPGNMMLFVKKTNEKALYLYRQAGFRIMGSRDESWLMVG